MKHAITATFTLLLALPSFAMEHITHTHIGSIIQETQSKITESSFSPLEKETLNNQLSTIQGQHDAVADYLDNERSVEQLNALLKELHEQASSTNKETLLAIENAQKEDQKFCFFTPHDPALEYARKTMIKSIAMHEKMLSDFYSACSEACYEPSEDDIQETTQDIQAITKEMFYLPFPVIAKSETRDNAAKMHSTPKHVGKQNIQRQSSSNSNRELLPCLTKRKNK